MMNKKLVIVFCVIMCFFVSLLAQDKNEPKRFCIEVYESLFLGTGIKFDYENVNRDETDRYLDYGFYLGTQVKVYRGLKAFAEVGYWQVANAGLSYCF